MSISDEELETIMSEISNEEPTPSAPAKEPALVSDAGLKRFVDPAQLSADVQINHANLDNDLVQHAGLYVHYAVQAVNARRQYERLKSAFEILEAKLDAEMREVMAAEGKKVTEAAIRNAIVADKRWSAHQAKLIEAQSIWKLAEVAERSFDQRRDMLLECARNSRKEREGDLRVKAAEAQREEVMGMVRARNAS